MNGDGPPIRLLLASTTKRLEESSDSARADAELLMAHVLDLPRGALLVRDDRTLEPVQRQRYDHLVRRREQGEPVAYLVGLRGFWTMDLEVNADVLVPRPETELLVRIAVDLAPFPAVAWKVADLGTGSGAVAIALAREMPNAEIVATDRSAAALAVARRNAGRWSPGRVGFVESDWYSAFPPGAAYDLIVSNPPYIAEGDPHVPALRHEPAMALTSGADGLDALRTIVAGSRGHLHPGAWLAVEHGADQGDEVQDLFARAGFGGIETAKDLAGLDRVTFGHAP